MAGHSKWQNIKRKKEANDAKKGKVFSKLARLIAVAAKQGGGDVDANPGLRLAVEKAKKANMPKDNIEKAILKGTGGGEGSDFVEVTYEAYGPGGGAYLISTLTDNSNRTVAELKNIFNKSGGSIGAPGSTSYIFSGEELEPSFYIQELTARDTEKVNALNSQLEDHDDVQEFVTNYKI